MRGTNRAEHLPPIWRVAKERATGGASENKDHERRMPTEDLISPPGWPAALVVGS